MYHPPSRNSRRCGTIFSIFSLNIYLIDMAAFLHLLSLILILFLNELVQWLSATFSTQLSNYQIWTLSRVPSFSFLHTQTFRKCYILPTLYVSNRYSPHKYHSQWFNLNCIHSSPPLVHYLILLKSWFPRTMFNTVSRGILIFLNCEIITDLYEIIRNNTKKSCVPLLKFLHW